MDRKNRFHLTNVEVGTLIAHEAVCLLDDKNLDAVNEFRTALEAFCTIQDLGEDGGTLLAWVDSEIENATSGYFADPPHLIGPDIQDLVPDAAAQVDAVWALFETAAADECDSESRKMLLGTAHMLTERNGLDELMLTADQHDMMQDAGALQEELCEVRENLDLVQAMTLPNGPAM